MEDPKNCALRPDGTLKDASEITWLNSPSDEKENPLENDPPAMPSQSGNAPVNDDASSTPPRQLNPEIGPTKRRIQVSSRFRDGSREPSFIKTIAGELAIVTFQLFPFYRTLIYSSSTGNRETTSSAKNDAGTGSTRGNRGTFILGC